MVHLLILFIKVQKKEKCGYFIFQQKPSLVSTLPTPVFALLSIMCGCVCECVSRGMQIKNLSLYSDFKCFLLVYAFSVTVYSFTILLVPEKDGF